jgi:hypothetical protein
MTPCDHDGRPRGLSDWRVRALATTRSAMLEVALGALSQDEHQALLVGRR